MHMLAASVGKSAPSTSVTDFMSSPNNGTGVFAGSSCQLMKSTVEGTWMLNPRSEFCFKMYYLKKSCFVVPKVNRSV